MCAIPLSFRFSLDFVYFSSSCHTGSLCPSLFLISAKINRLVTALLPLPRKMHGFLKAKGTGGHYLVCRIITMNYSIFFFSLQDNALGAIEFLEKM